MPFRFDSRHLTGQQRAIINQRDSADAELMKQSEERKKENGKIEAVKNFISKGKVFDVVIMKDRRYEVEATNHYNIHIELEQNNMIFIELGKQGEITAAGVDEVGERAIKLSFVDQDKNRIYVRILDRNASSAP